MSEPRDWPDWVLDVVPWVLIFAAMLAIAVLAAG